MKRVFALLVVIVLLMSCLTVVPVAMAEQVCYIVPEGVSVTFAYKEEDNSVFPPKTVDVSLILPYGYTIVLTDAQTSGAAIKATYCGIEGAISKADLDKLQVSPSAISLPQVAVTVDDLTVYRFEADGRKSIDVSADQQLLYMGDYVHNGVAYYVVRTADSHVSYYALCSHVSNRDAVEAAVHPRANSNDQISPATGSTEPAEAATDHSFTWVRFVLILGIIVPLITIIMMIVRPKGGRRRRVHREIYEGDDDYDGIDEV